MKGLMHKVVELEYFDGSYVDYLLHLRSEGVSFEEKDENEETILMSLSRKGHVKTMERLIKEWKIFG